jgi:predicted permease
MKNLYKDFQFALRMLLKNPLITLIAVLSLALGIGANTAIFSLINFLYLHTLPQVQDPAKVIRIYSKSRLTDYGSISFPDYQDYREGNQVFSQILAFHGEPMTLDLGGDPERIQGQLVTGSYFPGLGVRPAVGRAISPEDDRPEAPPVAVLSYGLWQRSFGSAPSAIGKSLRLNGNDFQVIGVAPPRFQGLDLQSKTEIWIAAHQAPLLITKGPPLLQQRGVATWRLAGRLKEGASIEQAKANIQAIALHLNEKYPGRFRRDPVLVPATQANFSPAARGSVSRFVGLLMTVVGVVLLIACVNIANLMLVRTARRRRELSVRQALGADRRRLMGQLLTESVLLALIGGALGLFVARVTLPLLARMQLPSEMTLDLDLDARVLGFTFILALLTGVVVGLVPALRASRPDLVTALKDTGGADPGKPRALKLRSLFVITQVALSLLLLIGAGLFLKSLQNLQSIDPGFTPQNLVMMSLDLGPLGYGDERGQAFYQKLLEQTAHLPGVQSLSLSSSEPIGSDFSSVAFFSDEVAEAKEGMQINLNLVAPGYFPTIGLTLLQGRDFTSADAGEPRVCIVNKTLADRFWPGQSPIGKRLRFSSADGDQLEVIGVARDGKYVSLREEPTPFIYLPYLQVFEVFKTTKHLLVRTSVPPGQILNEVRREVQAQDRNLPVFDGRTMEDHLATFIIRDKQTAALLLLLAGLALLLASIGLYGVMSYSVTQRSREIGIRMAIGAARGDVMKQLLTESAQLIAAGSIIGLGVAFGITRLVASLLFSVNPTDAVTFVTALVVLAAVGIAAGFFPAHRAASVNPMIAIRYD